MHATLTANMFINRPQRQLDRRLGLFGLFVIGVGGTIGGGIFVLLSPGAAVAGVYLPLSFLIGGVLALLGALLYAELGTTIPRSGSSIELVFTTTRRKYYPFMFSWLVLLGDVSYLVINALGVAFYANFFMAVNPTLIALLAVVIAVAINLRGVAAAGKSEMVIETSLVLLLAAFVAVGVSSPEFVFAPGEFIAAIPAHVIPMLAGVAVVFTTYVGYEYIASIAGEAENPAQDIPKALVLTVVTVTILFTTVSLVALNVGGAEGIADAEAPLLLAGEQLGAVGTYIVLPAALVATSGSLLAATLVSSRRVYALSQQGYMRQVFSVFNRHEVPYRAVLAVGVLALFLLLSGSVAFVAYISNTVYLVVMIVVAISLLRLRRQRPFLARPYRAPLFPWLPLLLIVLAGTILLFVGYISLAVTVLWLLAGYLVYMARRISPQQLYYAVWGAVLFLFVLGSLSFWMLLT